MKQLEQRIRQEGKILPGGIIKVDGFLNHQIDTQFLGTLADEFARRIDLTGVTKLLTAEASGIALTAVCSYRFGIPMVFAKKAKSDNIEGGLYKSEIFSYTYRKCVTLICSKQWIGADDRVLILDDFLANGQAVRGLIDIVHQSGASLAGIGIAVEKGFQHGGDALRDAGYAVTSLAIIDKADESGFVFREVD